MLGFRLLEPLPQQLLLRGGPLLRGAREADLVRRPELQMPSEVPAAFAHTLLERFESLHQQVRDRGQVAVADRVQALCNVPQLLAVRGPTSEGGCRPWNTLFR